jgi:hypothetical protein
MSSTVWIKGKITFNEVQNSNDNCLSQVIKERKKERGENINSILRNILRDRKLNGTQVAAASIQRNTLLTEEHAVLSGTVSDHHHVDVQGKQTYEQINMKIRLEENAKKQNNKIIF